MKRGWQFLICVIVLTGLCFTATALASELETGSTIHSAAATASRSRETGSLLTLAASEASAQSLGAQTAANPYPNDDPNEASNEAYPGSVENICGDLGYLPDYQDRKLTNAEAQGRCTWYLWTGDGDEKLYRTLTIRTNGKIDFLKVVDSRNHDQRFAQLGVMNDPGCKKAEKPDQYGLWIDECQDPHSSGIIGIRKYDNSNFDPQTWSATAYNARPAAIEPPYLFGLACASCHVSFNPLKPPADPEHPQWENLVPTIGNQYLREGALFSAGLKPSDFVWHVLDTQEPGTSDTSRIATDSINNPNAINSIFNLADRPLVEEIMPDGSTKAVPHILKDGADSIGIPGASVRVYVNIGTCSEYWLTRHDALLGRTPQRPFDPKTAEKICKGYGETEARMADAEAFLKTQVPLRLKDAEGGKAFLTANEEVLQRGKVAFANSCAQCHSSKQPPVEIATDPEQAKQWYLNSVLSPDFLDHNFLSDDKRYPVTQIGTNMARALATNAIQSHIWQQYSSKTYKAQPSPGTVVLENPFNAKAPIEFTIPSGGVGYYRTPSLISTWATAPLFHNNALGNYNADPSVKGRLDAYNDAMEKLLWPEKREHRIKRTSQDSILSADKLVNFPVGLAVPVPEGTPINLLANVNVRTAISQLLTRKLSWQDLDFSGGLPGIVSRLLLDINQSPDFVEDRGHLFGTNLPDEDKKALIEFVKTF
jgi:hypothetical protein